MAVRTYNKGKALLAQGFNFTANTVRAMLLKQGAAPFDETNDFVADIVADEIAATGYGRIDLATKAVTIVDADHLAKLTCDPIDFTAIGGAANETIERLVIFKFVTNDADSILIADYDTVLVVTDGVNKVIFTPDASGLMTIN